MKEIESYDRAAQKFYAQQEVNSLPLHSWDLFSTKLSVLRNGLDEVQNLKVLALMNKWEEPTRFEKEILRKNHIVVVTDANLDIVHASASIFDMNGYRPEEVIGKKPKMFQGDKTCHMTSKKIGEAFKNHKSFEEVVLNYRKNGSIYRCWIQGFPIRNRKGEVVNFIAFEREVA